MKAQLKISRKDYKKDALCKILIERGRFKDARYVALAKKLAFAVNSTESLIRIYVSAASKHVNIFDVVSVAQYSGLIPYSTGCYLRGWYDQVSSMPY